MVEALDRLRAIVEAQKEIARTEAQRESLGRVLTAVETALRDYEALPDDGPDPEVTYKAGIADADRLLEAMRRMGKLAEVKEVYDAAVAELTAEFEAAGPEWAARRRERERLTTALNRAKAEAKELAEKLEVPEITWDTVDDLPVSCTQLLKAWSSELTAFYGARSSVGSQEFIAFMSMMGCRARRMQLERRPNHGAQQQLTALFGRLTAISKSESQGFVDGITRTQRGDWVHQERYWTEQYAIFRARRLGEEEPPQTLTPTGMLHSEPARTITPTGEEHPKPEPQAHPVEEVQKHPEPEPDMFPEEEGDHLEEYPGATEMFSGRPILVVGGRSNDQRWISGIASRIGAKVEVETTDNELGMSVYQLVAARIKRYAAVAIIVSSVTHKGEAAIKTAAIAADVPVVSVVSGRGIASICRALEQYSAGC